MNTFLVLGEHQHGVSTLCVTLTDNFDLSHANSPELWSSEDKALEVLRTHHLISDVPEQFLELAKEKADCIIYVSAHRRYKEVLAEDIFNDIDILVTNDGTLSEFLTRIPGEFECILEEVNKGS